MSAVGSLDQRSLLKKVSIFRDVADAELDLLLQITTTKRLKPKEVLFRKGDPGKQLYGIMSGRLRVSAAGEDGKEVVFCFLDAGEVVGEIALLDSNPRSATVEAVDSCELLTLHRRDLIPFLEKHPRVTVNLAAVLAGQVRRLSELMEDTLFLTLPSRLAKKLLSLAQSYGRPGEKGTRIEMRLPQGELGELVGSSRESVNKQLRSWSEESIVEFDRGYVTILDHDRLESLAHMLL
ncbi:MAG: Crp/Fnr family transcriptional regulator [bacterium]|nr:Crp/Fnr family transcriptional regulator [bacterium]